MTNKILKEWIWRVIKFKQRMWRVIKTQAMNIEVKKLKKSVDLVGIDSIGVTAFLNED